MRLFFGLFFSLSISVVFAQKITLEEVLQLSVQNSENVKIASLQQQQFENSNSRFNSGQLPELQLQLGTSGSVNNTNQTFVDGRELVRTGANASNTSAAVQVVWNLFDGFGMFHRKSLFESTALESKERTFQQQLTTKIIATQSFFSVLTTSEQLPILRENIAISRERLELTSYRKTIGLSTEYDVLLASQAVIDDSISYLQLENLQANQILQLSRIVGKSLKNYQFVSPTKTNVTSTLEAVKEQYYANNPFYREALIRMESAKIRKKSLMATQLPSIDFVSSVSLNRSASEAGFLASNITSQLQFGLQLSYPLSQAFDFSSRVENSQLDVSIEELALKRLENDVTNDFERRIDQIQRLQQMVMLNKETVEVSDKILSIDKSKLDLGQISGIDFRNLQLDGLRRKRILSTSKLEELQSTVELELLLLQR